MIAVVVVFLIGTVGYMLIEHWSILDALYMTAITITTVGFGETMPLSPPGRIFTIFLIFIGLGTAATFAANLAKGILEHELKGIFGGNKMKKQINLLSNHYIIAGFGNIGRAIAASFDQIDVSFVIIENDEESADTAVHQGYLTVTGNATSDTTLLLAGIKRAAGIIICLSEDADNIFVTLAARELNPNLFILARGQDPSIEKRMLRAGANTVVYPLQLGGQQIARIIAQTAGLEIQTQGPATCLSSVMGYSLKMYRHFDQMDITVEDTLKKTEADTALKIQKSDGRIIEHPARTEKVQKNDSVLFLVKDMEDLENDDRQIVTEKPPLIEWSEDLSCGISSVDEEHKRLFELTNTFVQALYAKREQEVLQGIFDELLEYTRVHFKHEEAIHEKYDYPSREKHRREHQELTEKVRTLSKSRSFIFSKNLVDFLYSWLREHIVGSDTAFSAYLFQRKDRETNHSNEHEG